jgi:hypothetical protein
MKDDLKWDDAARLGELARRLATPDLDGARAAAIADRARRAVGHAGLWRFVEPVIIGALTSSYFVWAIARVYDALPHR